MKFEPCPDLADAFKVSGRGEMQLAVLIETMRREGFEIAVCPPQVVFRDGPNNTHLEPIEEILIDCDPEHCGVVVEGMSRRKGELLRMQECVDGRHRIVFKGPTRGLIGYLTELKNATKGTATLHHAFLSYEDYKGPISTSRKGALISMADGFATGYAVADLESRGTLFVSPGAAIYAGMVIGECSRSTDLDVNPCRTKELTNIRSTVKDEYFRLRPAAKMTLEESISYMAGILISLITIQEY
jgi:GTP-binding protein